MRRVFTVLTALLTATVTALSMATPASAFAITAGFMVTSGGRWCTVSFPDPVVPHIVYTAGHCFRDGVTEVSLGNIRIGQFIPETYNQRLDVIAIRLYSDIPSEYTLMSREPLLDTWVPNEGATVCKYGATTQETCGKVLAVDDEKFSVEMPADHGDSGAPIYQQSLDGDNQGVHLVGVINAADHENPNIIYCTKVNSIANYLGRTWGSDWDMA